MSQDVITNEATEHTTRAIELVEGMIAGLGVELDKARQPDGDRGERRFAIARGTAVILVQVSPAEGDAFGRLRCVAPVIDLPETRRPELFQQLLEHNVGLSGMAFAITERQAILVSERSVEDLDGSEVQDMIRDIGETADRFDDELAEAFGTRRATDL